MGKNLIFSSVKSSVQKNKSIKFETFASRKRKKMPSTESKKPYCAWCYLPFQTQNELQGHLEGFHGATKTYVTPELKIYYLGLKRKSENPAEPNESQQCSLEKKRKTMN